ncbi:MAG: tol-pal system-associated acyl-CoA thioesterase, partial [Wenzhouxiangellaceae bacterium]
MNPDARDSNPVFCYRVYWEDTDAGGVVYHARYLHFLERARSDWLSAIGVNQTRLREDARRIFVVTRVELDFRRPARLEDELAVSVSVQHCGHARIDFSQQIRRGDAVLIDAVVRAACLDAERFVPARMPA